VRRVRLKMGLQNLFTLKRKAESTRKRKDGHFRTPGKGGWVKRSMSWS
jgi:hypothetical protein